MRKSFLFNCLLFYSFFGCKSYNPQHDELLTNKSTKVVNHRITNLEINAKVANYKLFDTFDDEGVLYLILFDGSTQYLEIINLHTNHSIFYKPINTIINNIEPYGDVLSLEFVNFDSIFVLQYNAIQLIDTAKLISTIEINQDFDENYKKYLLTNMDHAPIYFDKVTNSLSIQSYCHACFMYKKNYYESPIHVAYSLENKRFTALPLQYSKKYLKQYYGFHTLVFRSEYKNKYLVGFSADPNVYIYDKITNNTTTYGGKSKYQHGEISTLKLKYKNDSNKKLKHLTLSPVYKEFLYDGYRDLYYRFLLNGVNEKNPDGTYNRWHDKELILMVFDSEMELLTEVPLGKCIYNSHKSFVSDKGLCLYKGSASDTIISNNLRYDIFEIF